jgi:hypothetical protein
MGASLVVNNMLLRGANINFVPQLMVEINILIPERRYRWTNFFLKQPKLDPNGS